MRASWSVRFEVIARALKANAARLSRLSWPEQRKQWAAMARPSPVFEQCASSLPLTAALLGKCFIPKAAAAEPVVLYFHGGSFIYGSAKDTHRVLNAREALAAGARVFAPEYRLAPEQRFSCAIEDPLAVYRRLLESEIPASRIVIAGESAGGNLALVTLLRARDAQIARPAGAALASPCVDQSARDGSMAENARFDWALDAASCLLGQSACRLGSQQLLDLAGL